MYDIVVFENHRFRLSKRSWKPISTRGSIFENMGFGCPFSSDTRRQQVKPEEKYPFSIKNADTREGGLNSFHIWEEK